MKRALKIYGELWRVQTINYCQDSVNIVLGVVLTTVTMLCWVAFKPTITGGLSTDAFVLSSAIGISIIRNSQYNFDLTITDWREKKLFERLALTPISRKTVMVSILTFNWFINIAVGVFLFALAMIFKNQREILKQVQWGPFLVGFIVNVVLSNFMALFVVVLIKNKALVLVVSLLSYFGPMYLLGLGIPWNIVGNYEGLNIFLYIWPHRYPLAIMQSAWVGTANNMSYPVPLNLSGADLIDWNNSWLAKEGFGYGGQGWWVPLLVSIGWIGLFSVGIFWIINEKYNFGQRRFKQYKGIQKHLHYISQIKRAKSVEELNVLMSHVNSNNLNNKKTKDKSKDSNRRILRLRQKREEISKEI